MSENINRSNHEIITAENPPSAEQLFALSSLVMVNAKKFGKYRSMKTHPRAHYGMFATSYLNECASDEYPTEIRRMMAIRIGRKVIDNMAMKHWSMKIYDTSWYERPGGDWDGVRNRFSFEWTDKDVLMSERETYHVPRPQDDLEDALVKFSIPDDLADMIHAEQQFAEVTAGDYDQLVEEINNYINS